METMINVILYILLVGGVVGLFYWFYKILAGGFSVLKNDDD